MNESVLHELPRGWVWTSVGEVISFEYGKGLTADKREQKGNVPVYGSNGIVGYHSITLIEKPCLIIGRKGAAGYVHISKVPCWPIDTTYYVIPPDKLNLVFLYYLLSTLNLNSLDKSTAIPGLNRNDAYALKIPLPPLPEQHRIVTKLEELFTRLDAGVSELKKMQAQLKRYRQSVLKTACEGKLVLTEAELAKVGGRAYEPADLLLVRILKERREKWNGKGKYKEPATLDTSGLQELPEGWIWSNFGQAFNVYVGATPSRKRPDYWCGQIPWVSSGEVAFCKIFQTKETITELGLTNTSTEVHPPGTVLLGMIGEGKTRGQAAILEINACNNQNSAAIRVSEAGLPSEYIFYFLEGYYERTRTMGSGNNQPALNKSRVQSMIFPLPPLAEQRRIVLEVERRLSIADGVEKTVAQSLAQAQRLRQSILKKAFEGRLVAQDANDEPAGVLLERIKQEKEQMGEKKRKR